MGVVDKQVRERLPEAPTKRVFIKSYGCQMNVYDAQRMGDALAPAGFEPAASPEEADLVILNTCHIREKAADKVYSEIGRLRRLKADREAAGQAPLRVAVAGCVAQAEGDVILERAPSVDFVFGPQTYHRLPQMVAAVEKGARGLVDTEFPAESKFDSLPLGPLAADFSPAPKPVTAFVTVQEGCDKFCTFCVVPYTRGAEVSRPVAAIVEEVRHLLEQGVREVTLLGQNVNAYHGLDGRGREVSLAGLLYRLSELPGLARLRYTTSHPRDMGEDLIEAHGALPSLMPYLHLPVQAGSDRILKAMNRQHTAADYLALIERIREAAPGLALSSDFIVGFPGESDADFEATLGLIREVGFAQSFSFKYSPRPGTPAAEREPVPEPVKEARLAALQSLLRTQQIDFSNSLLGKRFPVLFEKPGRHGGQIAGRSPYLQPVHVQGPATLIGTLAEVEIKSVGANSLAGTLVADQGREAVRS